MEGRKGKGKGDGREEKRDGRGGEKK